VVLGWGWAGGGGGGGGGGSSRKTSPLVGGRNQKEISSTYKEVVKARRRAVRCAEVGDRGVTAGEFARREGASV
jgi:hypothetical protein